MIHVEGFLQDNIITPLELTTNYNRWRNENVNSDFQTISGNPSKNRLTNRYKTTSQISFTGVISKLHIPSKSEVRLANDFETLQAVEYFASTIRQGTSNSNQLNTYILDSGKI